MPEVVRQPFGASLSYSTRESSEMHRNIQKQTERRREAMTRRSTVRRGAKKKAKRDGNTEFTLRMKRSGQAEVGIQRTQREQRREKRTQEHSQE